MALDSVQAIEGAPRHNCYESVMLDLETLGVGTNAAIVSVGMVCFDQDGSDVAASLHLGISKPLGNIEIDTTMWWLRQPDEARKRIVDVVQSGDTELIVCTCIASFVRQYGIKELWSNGPSFDERLLREMFDRNIGAGRFPLAYNCGRDYRTFLDTGALLGVPKVEREGVAHDALSDAIHQANNAAAILRHLRGLPR